MSGIFGCLALILTLLVQTNFAKEVRTNEFSIPLIIFSIKSCDSSAHITLGQHPNIFFNWKSVSLIQKQIFPNEQHTLETTKANNNTTVDLTSCWTFYRNLFLGVMSQSGWKNIGTSELSALLGGTKQRK